MEQQISLSGALALIARLKENPVDRLPVSETFGAEIIDAISG